VAKAVALGAAACGIAGAFLHAANESTTAVADLIAVLVAQLRVAMFAIGAIDIAALGRIPIAAVS
jgi:isopentenyl-diphosphate delta-isomerase